MRKILLCSLAIVIFLIGGGLLLWGVGRSAPESSAPHWISSAVASTTLLLMAVCTIGALCSRESRRAAWAGAALAGILYWAAVFSGWFGPSVGSRLVTTRALAKMEQLASPQSGDGDDAIQFSGGPVTLRQYNTLSFDPSGSLLGSNNNLGIVGSGRVVWTYPQYPYPLLSSGSVYSSGPIQYSGPNAFTAFQEIGHYLLIWPLALLAAWLAAFLYARARRLPIEQEKEVQSASAQEQRST